MRRDLLANATHILGSDSTVEARRRLALGVLKNFGASLAELAAARRWFREGARPIAIEGRDHFDAAANLGRGIVAVSLHMGCYEIGSMVLARKIQESGRRATIVYHRDPSACFEHMRSSQRKHGALDEVAIDGSPFFGIELINRLRERGAILLAGELAREESGEPFPFLNGIANFSLWPARLAINAGAPVLPAFTVREGAARSLTLRIEKPLVATSTDTPHTVTARLVRVFETYVRRYPEQWLMVRPFWRDGPAESS